MAEEKKQKNKAEIIEEEQAEEPARWTFQKYIKSIAHFKWWIIGFTLFGALTGYLGFRFILNPTRKKLTATYTYDLAGTYTDTDTIRFIDGTLFNPYDLTNKDILQKVKDSDDKYKSIDITVAFRIVGNSLKKLTDTVKKYSME